MALKISNFIISNVKVGIIFMCAFSFCYGANSTYIVAMITTLEKRFELSSMELGLLLGANDIGYLTSVIFVSYFGSRNGREPFMLCFSAVALWVSSMVYTLPYAIFGSKFSSDDLLNLNMSRSSANSICSNSSAIVVTAKSASLFDASSNDITHFEKNVAFGILMLAGVLNGIATTPFWTIGLSFVDDMAGPKNSGIYIGLLFGIRSCSPIMGFLIGAEVLKHHESLKITLDQYSPGQKDIKWIGAWWLGWLTLGFAVLVNAPFLLLLRAKKKSPEIEAKETLESFLEKEDEVPLSFIENIKDGLKDLFGIIKESLQNKIYTLLIGGMIFEIISMVCLFNFFSKYLEFHYRVPASLANTFTGLSLAGSSVLAALISGVTSHIFKTNLRNMNRYHAIVNTLSGFLFLILIVFNCPSSHIMGMFDESRTAVCSSACNCPLKNLKPVCLGNMTYFSPCVAGCSNQINNTHYSQCGCTNKMLAVKGFCEEMCPSVYGFLVAFFIIKVIGSIASVQFTQILLRLTEPKNKAVYMSAISFIYGIAGFALPPLSGLILDTACQYRNVNKYGIKSHCLTYDNDKLRYIIIGFAFAVQIPASILYIWSWLVTPVNYEYKRKSSKASVNMKKSSTANNENTIELTAQ